MYATDDSLRHMHSAGRTAMGMIHAVGRSHSIAGSRLITPTAKAAAAIDGAATGAVPARGPSIIIATAGAATQVAGGVDGR